MVWTLGTQPILHVLSALQHNTHMNLKYDINTAFQIPDTIHDNFYISLKMFDIRNWNNTVKWHKTINQI